MPRHIDAVLVGDPGPRTPTIGAVQAVARGSLVFRRYAALPAALRARIVMPSGNSGRSVRIVGEKEPGPLGRDELLFVGRVVFRASGRNG